MKGLQGFCRVCCGWTGVKNVKNGSATLNEHKHKGKKCEGSGNTTSSLREV